MRPKNITLLNLLSLLKITLSMHQFLFFFFLFLDPSRSNNTRENYITLRPYKLTYRVYIRKQILTLPRHLENSKSLKSTQIGYIIKPNYCQSQGKAKTSIILPPQPNLDHHHYQST